MKDLATVTGRTHGRIRPQESLRCGIGITASFILLIATTVTSAQDLAAQSGEGIQGVPTESSRPVRPTDGTAAEAIEADAAVQATPHERGYPMDLEAARRMPPVSGYVPHMQAVEPPRAIGAAGPEALAPPLGTKFEGIGDTGSFPADPALAVGAQRIIQVVNSSFRITTRTGTSASTRSLSSFFGTPSGADGFAFDPRVHYDHFQKRFVMLALTRNAAKTDSWYLVAVSKSETPTVSQGSWHRYHLRSDLNGSSNPAVWGDYAPIGFDNNYFYITSNQFSPAGAFQYAKIKKYSKAPFYSGSSVSGVQWSNVKDRTGAKAFTIQPAVAFGGQAHGWLASVPFGSTNRLNVFRITGNSLYKYSVTVGSTQLPNTARQKGSSTGIHSGDNRLLNAVISNNRLYVGQTVKIGSFPCAVRVLGVNTSNRNVPVKALEKVIGNSTTDYYYPAVAANPAGSSTSRIAVAFNFSSSTRYAGITYTQMKANGVIQSLGLAKEGQRSYVKLDGSGRNRWGDYNGIARDPLNSRRFFFNAMYAGPTLNKWNTYVASTVISTTTSPSTSPPVEALANANSGPTPQAVGKTPPLFGPPPFGPGIAGAEQVALPFDGKPLPELRTPR